MQTLSLRALGRATLARQLLLRREAVPVVEAVARLGGLQAQEPKPPFLALWSRLEGFDAAELKAALHHGDLVRATWVRATLHLVTKAEFGALRPTLQPMLHAAMKGTLRGRDAGLDLDTLLPVARDLLAERPRTFNELRPELAARFPDVNVRALGYAVRTGLPLVMVPTEDRWAFAADSAFALAGTTTAEEDPQALVRRHLAAFGPATAADVQTWSGLRGLGPVLEQMASELVALQDEQGRTLFDLPDAPRPDEDTPAPARLLPEFDALLLAHADRTRIVSDEHRKGLVTKNLRVRAVFLVDGVAAGTWSRARASKRVTVTLQPFGALPPGAAEELEAEARGLLAFAEAELEPAFAVAPPA